MFAISAVYLSKVYPLESEYGDMMETASLVLCTELYPTSHELPIVILLLNKSFILAFT